MGEISGDKSRHYRNRRKKFEKRAKMRALRATLGAPGAASQGEKSKPAKQ